MKKVCENCSAEIAMREGENLCQYCDAMNDRVRAIVCSKARREREKALRDCGLVKVRGALGGTYWE